MAARILMAMLVSLSLLLSACGSEILEDLGSQTKYRTMLGAKYQIVGHVTAYGIQDYERIGDGVLYVVLIPGPGISGPEVAFKVPVVSGSIFHVQRVMKSQTFLESSIVYVGSLTGTTLPTDKEVRLGLRLGNEGIGSEPNIKIYQRLN